MKAYHLVKYGKPTTAFELRDIKLPPLKEDEVLVEIEAFGMNFADIMARKGLYDDCPPLPAIIGYESVGRIKEKGKAVRNVNVGERVIAFTRFGSYAQFAITPATGVARIAEDYPAGKALALATQYCTAYYAACVATNVMPGDKILIQAAAGGVGTALTQLCKRVPCTIYGTAGSDKKLAHIKANGVDHPINYRKEDFAKAIKEPLDIVFDSLGGAAYKKGFKCLNPGGKMVAFGAATQPAKLNIPGTLKFAANFGIFSPIQFLQKSQSLIAINMLRIADYRPDIMEHCLQSVVKLAEDGVIDPHEGGMFPHTELAEAHRMMEGRETLGKVGLYW